MLGVPHFVTPAPVVHQWRFEDCGSCDGSGLARSQAVSDVPGVGDTSIVACPECRGRGHHLRLSVFTEPK